MPNDTSGAASSASRRHEPAGGEGVGLLLELLLVVLGVRLLSADRRGRTLAEGPCGGDVRGAIGWKRRTESAVHDEEQCRQRIEKIQRMGGGE